MKAQVSVEYLMIMGFVFVITIPLLLIYFTYTDAMSDEIKFSQVDKVAKKIVDASETVHYLGEPSQTILKVYVPGGIDEVIITDREINYRVKSSNGITDLVRISAANMTGSLPKEEGIHFITVKAVGNEVELSYT